MERLRALWSEVTDSLWLLPSLLTLAGGAAAVLLVAYNDAIIDALGVDVTDVWWLFGGSAEGAKSVLESISGSIITVTGVVFSVTIIALQLASSQFTPRVLRQFMADRGNQAVLGVFIGTFTYTLLVQRTIRGDANDETFVPALAVTTAVLLALTSIGFFIYFINHLARSIQAAVVIDSATTSTVGVLRKVFPERLQPGVDERAPSAAELLEKLGLEDGTAQVITAPKAGYLQGIDRRLLLDAAEESDLVICMEVEIGAWLMPGLTVMRVWPARKVEQEKLDELCSALVLGLERTPLQDLKNGTIELMDIAVKGLSPSINDPTTAVNAIQRQAEILLDLAWRVRGDSVSKDDSGAVRVIVRRPRLDDVVDLAFNQVRHYGGDNPSVMIALIETLATLSALSPPLARPAFVQQLQLAIATASDRIDDDGDRVRVQQAAAEALRVADTPPPLQRPHPD
jgi:uncharacterized membrane protein